MCAWVVGCGGRSNEPDGAPNQEGAELRDGNPPTTDPVRPSSGLQSGKPASTVGRVPEKHRAAAVSCDDQRPAGDGRPFFVGSECSTDADCTGGHNGRCQDFRGTTSCTYDQCAVDADCTSGGPCACEGAFWSDANACLPGNCRTDVDCAAGSGYCSPTYGDCGNYTGVIAYQCHTPDDACLDDADCAGNEMQGPGYCMYRPELGHWECGYGQCVG